MTTQPQPPQRIAADHDHPWYDPFWTPQAEVLVDGEVVPMVRIADGYEGWIEAYQVETVNGRLRLVKDAEGNPATYRRYGAVTIERKAPPPRPAPAPGGTERDAPAYDPAQARGAVERRELASLPVAEGAELVLSEERGRETMPQDGPGAGLKHAGLHLGLKARF